MSSYIFKDYDEMLINKKLITKDKGEYELTLKGYNLLNDLEKIKRTYGLFTK